MSAHVQKLYALSFVLCFGLLYLLLNNCNRNAAKHNAFSLVDLKRAVAFEKI